MLVSSGAVGDLNREAYDLMRIRSFRSAMEKFQTARKIANSEVERAYSVLGDEECQLHLRLPAEDGPEALEAALALFRSREDRRAEAWALICLGIRAQSRRDFGAAVSRLSEAAAVASDAGEREAEARALLDTATMLTFRREPGDVERMQQAFARGYELASFGDTYEKAVADATRGIVRYAASDFTDSVQGYKAAAVGFSAIGMPEQALETSVALGVAFYRGGSREEAEKVFLEATRLGVKLGRAVETGAALMYLGQLAENSSRYAEAFSRYDESERRLGPENMYGITLRLGQARALCAMGRYAEAWSRLGRLQGQMSASTRVGLPMVKASALSSMGRYAEAIAQADLAVAEAATRGMAEREADARAVRMWCRQRMGADGLAMEDARSILDPLAATAAAVVRGKALTFLATQARRRGDIEEASRNSKAAGDLLREVDAPLELAHALAEQGRAAWSRGDMADADAALREACSQALAVRRDAPEAYRRDFLDSIHEIFSARIEFLIHEGRPEEAYRTTLKLLARSMAERFHLSGDESPPDIGDAVEFVFLPLDTSVAVFARSARGLSARLAKLDHDLFARLGAFEGVDLSAFGGLARGFSLTDSGADAAASTYSALSRIISGFKEEVRKGGPSFLAHTAALYDFFFASDEIAASDRRRWILCPAGILSTFPFEALMDSEGSFVIEKRSLRYVKTPLLAGDSYHSAGSVRPSVLAVGDPLFTRAKEGAPGTCAVPPEESGEKGEAADTFETSVLRFIERGGGAELPLLPGAAKEARSACSLSGRNVLLLGQDATKKKFIEALSGAPWGILHLAAHALYSESGREGAILFHPDGDNILSAQEVAALAIDVDVVVLSACASALGKPSWSEGSVGLVDAFLEAGAGNVHATLWSVYDAPTAEFMAAVYEQYGDGGKDFDAVFLDCRRRAARGDLGPALAAPSLWAAFVHYGR